MDADLVVPLAGMLTGIILGLPIIRAVVRAVESKIWKTAKESELQVLRQEVDDLRATLDHQASDTRERLLDVEERLDFAERLLTRAKEGKRPPAAGSS